MHDGRGRRHVYHVRRPVDELGDRINMILWLLRESCQKPELGSAAVCTVVSNPILFVQFVENIFKFTAPSQNG